MLSRTGTARFFQWVLLHLQPSMDKLYFKAKDLYCIVFHEPSALTYPALTASPDVLILHQVHLDEQGKSVLPFWPVLVPGSLLYSHLFSDGAYTEQRITHFTAGCWLEEDELLWPLCQNVVRYEKLSCHPLGRHDTGNVLGCFLKLKR